MTVDPISKFYAMVGISSLHGTCLEVKCLAVVNIQSVVINTQSVPT